MKKIYSLVLGFIICLSCFFFVGCNKSKNSIDMSTYFLPTVNTSIYKNSSSTISSLPLSPITSNTPHSIDQYLQYELTANTDWFYGMYVEKISFYIYSNRTQEEEFTILFTGMQNGSQDGGSETKYFKTELPFYLKENKGIKITIDINDIATQTTNKLTIAPKDKENVFKNNNFKYCIYGLEIIAEHK